MKSSGLFKDYIKFLDEDDFSKRTTLKENIVNNWKDKHDSPDTDSDMVMEFIEEEYKKGILRHELRQ